MSSRGRTDVETFQEFVFRFSKVMPEFDEEFRVRFMNFSFGASFGDCRVLQFEGKVEVFRGGGVQEFHERFFRRLLGDCRALQSEGMVVFFVVVEYKNLLCDFFCLELLQGFLH